MVLQSIVDNQQLAIFDWISVAQRTPATKPDARSGTPKKMGVQGR
jgi:hypothetical protein